MTRQMTFSYAPRPFSMVGPGFVCSYHGDEIMRRRLFDSRVLYVMRVANVLRSIEAKPVLPDLTTCAESASFILHRLGQQYSECTRRRRGYHDGLAAVRFRFNYMRRVGQFYASYAGAAVFGVYSSTSRLPRWTGCGEVST